MNTKTYFYNKRGIEVRSSYSPLKNKFFLIASDMLTFIVAAFLGYIILPVHSVYTEGSVNLEMIGRQGSYILSGLLAVFWFWGNMRHYTYRKPFWDELREMYSTLSIIAMIDLVSISFFYKGYSPSVWLVTWGSAIVLLPIFRQMTKIYLKNAGYWNMPSIIIGDSENAREAYLAIKSEPSTGFTVEAFVDPTGKNEGVVLEGIPYISKVEYLTISKNQDIKVFIALQKSQSKNQEEWLRLLAKRNVKNISIVPDLRGIPLMGMDVSHFFSHEIMMLRVKNNLARRSSKIIKRVFDILVSAILLLLLTPFLAVIYFKVTKDGGTATYGHERVGRDGKVFKCWKFRSMVMNSQEVLEELLKNDPKAKLEWDLEFKLKDDPRVTPIGAFLRKSSLDELPQLWNVLKGEMSLVGPRPIINEELARYEADVAYYLIAKPGMSGLWQVSGRSDTDYPTRVYLDSWYVKNWSLWNDLVILFKTVGVVLKKEGAY